MSKNKYWMTLEQWKDEKTFQKLAQSEFVTPPFSPEEGAFDRREFLKLMGASLALSSLGCLRRPAETIVPHIERPVDQTPGISNYYASSFFDEGEGMGIIVETREGRPIKIEGHPNHPMNQGGLSSRAHSHLLELYDPERLKTPQKNLFNKEKTNKESIRAPFDTADPYIVDRLKKGKTALLTDDFPSPASLELIKDFSKAYPCSHFVWDPSNLGLAAKKYQECFKHSQAFLPGLHLDQAQMIVSLNCDFLGTFLSPVEFGRKFSLSRKPSKNMSRLVVFESLLSLTGTNADERYTLLPSEDVYVLLTMIDEVLSLNNSYPEVRKNLQKKLKPLKMNSVIRKTAAELLKNQGLVLADSKDSSVLVLSYFLNSLLKNDSIIDEVHYYKAFENPKPSLDVLIQDLQNGNIQNLIIHRTNPLYSYPDQKTLREALKKVDLIIYTGSHKDETFQVSDYIIPDPHDLEKWGEWEFQKGISSIQQPTIRPLIQSRTFEDNLIIWSRMSERGSEKLKKTPSWHSYLQDSVSRRGISWKELLKKGFKKTERKSTRKSFHVPVVQAAIENIKTHPSRDSNLFELQIYKTSGLRGGKMANVSWLQEFPDPVTKICWGNYVCLSPLDAEKLSLKEGEVVKISNQEFSLKAPVHVQPGQSSGVLGLALGYGRKGAGEIAEGVGVNAYPFLDNKDLISVQKTGKKISLAQVQGHHSMEGRQIVVETALSKYLKNPASGIHKHKIFSLWSEHDYPREKWGMVIDLNSCTGCGVCITACQSENNVPVVGKKYVLQGREMHWMRVDRYYRGSDQDIKSVVHQPVLCMHCDNAPCETVCPVAATVHSDEGTNDMIYNRCVGTRYCSNNCPYKVRRFNWFDYSKKTPAGALNPDVTVRSRGVMEKCTFCIHRIRSKQAESRLKGKKLKDGDIQTACQQSCPSKAIVFGNLNDKKSAVRKAFTEKNSYALLEELNTKPAVRYRTKIKNSENPFFKTQKGH